MNRMKTIVAMLAVVLTLTAARRADAVATSSASAQITVMVTGFLDGSGNPIAKPGDLTVEGVATEFDMDVFADGNANATIPTFDLDPNPDPDPLDVGDGTTQSVEVTTDADAPFGFAFAFAQSDGDIFLENTSSTDTYTVEFSAAWQLDAAMAIDDVFTEFALTDAIVTLETFDGSVPALVLEEELFAESDFDPSPFMDSDMDTLAFSVTLGPGDFTFLFATADVISAAGSGFAPVPEPTTALLSLAGLVGLALRRHRKA